MNPFSEVIVNCLAEEIGTERAHKVGRCVVDQLSRHPREVAKWAIDIGAFRFVGFTNGIEPRIIRRPHARRPESQVPVYIEGEYVE